MDVQIFKSMAFLEAARAQIDRVEDKDVQKAANFMDDAMERLKRGLKSDLRREHKTGISVEVDEE